MLNNRTIKMRDGSDLSVEMTERFCDILVRHFNLESSLDIGDDHIRMYFYGAVKTAIDKAEKLESLNGSK